MTQQTVMQTAYIAGELAPAMWGRVDNEKYKFGASTMRNGFANFQGGYASRAGLVYVGMTKQAAPNAGGTPTSNPPRDIPFQFSVTQGYVLEFGDQYMRVKFQGAYVTEAAQNVVSITQNSPGVITITGHGYSNGDWLFGQNIGGMTAFNSLTWIVQNVTTNTFTLTDLFGVPVNTAVFPAFTSGGTFSRIYTAVAPYAAVDLPYLKFTQSADEMSLACWNQVTLTEYPPYDLSRQNNTDWVFTQTAFDENIAPPANVAVTAQSSTTLDTWYAYVVTAIDAATNSESVASATVYVQNNDISINAGSNTITWSPVAGAASYNVYQSIPFYSTGANSPQIGVPFGYIGTALGTSFVDSNITADFTQTPPLHSDPFARGSIVEVVIATPGSGLTQANISYTITTSTGSGFSGVPIVLNGGLNGFYIASSGKLYQPGDTITFTDSDMGSVVGTATLTIGPETGTYPGSVAYFQERRAYGGTENNPDTYYMSQPGAFTNMDAAIPSVDTDAIIGTPWGQQVNGIQFMTPMPGGLVIFTGGGAWQLNGGNSTALTPSSQDAQPQSRYGCSSTIPPIPINFHILFVRENDGIVYDLVYNFWANIYQGSDLTIYSSHLFEGYTIIQWAYSEKPYKLVWAVRSDGVMLSLTYIAEQAEQGWARHDTNGLFIGVCSIEEPPVDAVYVITQRFVRGQWVYYSERFNNRIWTNAEDCFCVDAGLTYPMNFPSATLFAAAADGTNNITSSVITFGGKNYTNPLIQAIDATGVGSGATFSAVIAGGVITNIIPLTKGNNYTEGQTEYVITDPTGSDCIASPVITNFVNFVASASVFTSNMIGDVIRTGNGRATIVTYVSATQVVADITAPITATINNDPTLTPIPSNAGSWSISTPSTVVSGLNHLEGLTVTGTADGGVIAPTIVENGQITLAQAASAISVGLPFLPQLQALYMEAPSPSGSIQTKRKNTPSIGIRVHNTRGISAGKNQPDASTQTGNVNVPWTGMVAVKELNQSIPMGQPIPLHTGDYFENIGTEWNVKGQVAFQQNFPLPMNIDAHVIYGTVGDT